VGEPAGNRRLYPEKKPKGLRDYETTDHRPGGDAEMLKGGKRRKL